MKYGSVCSGIEAASVAIKQAGLDWNPAFFSEIDKFPRGILQHHYPDVPLHGDFTTIGEDDYGPIRLLCGGTPCQSFSVAGKRRGLDDPRGDLSLEFIRLAERKNAVWLVFENVPGLLSSAGGEDFATFISAATGYEYPTPDGGWKKAGIAEGKSEKWGIAWRVLDAQYFGVAQRRRRVIVIGYLGNWRPAAAVLFEPESMRGNPAPRREKGKKVAGTLEARAGTGGYDPGAHGAASGHLVAYGGNNTSGSIEIAAGINGGGMKRIDFESETFIAIHENQRGEVRLNDITSLNTGGGKPGQGYPAALQNNIVRRLTEKECERLQGFPDDYTQIPWRSKSAENCPGGPRYKGIGNSWAVPKFAWLFKRIDYIDGILEAEK